MSSISSTNSNTAASNASPLSAATGGQAMGKDAFLKLLVAQIANQDPMKPMDLPGRGGLRGRAGDARAVSFESLRRQFDRNDDGRIEKSEVAPLLHRRFDQLDANRDGVLTQGDFGNE